MADARRKKLRRATIIYWMLLLYIVAALAWWYIILTRQNNQIRDLELQNLERIKGSEEYSKNRILILTEYRRNNSKYLGEGSIFFLLLMVGAAFVYRSVRKQFTMSQQQQNFMMAVTHELKTPISVTRLNLETLQKYNLDPEKQKKIIKTTLDETARLNFLTTNILVASQLEGDGYKSPKEELDFSTLLKDSIAEFCNRHPDRKIIDDIEEDTDIRGDALLLQMLINNLLENAVKYSPRETPVEVRLKKYRSGVELNIKDQGPGIPDPEKKKIFSKFYRIGNEATRRTQGTGLGLYLCLKIAKDHNGDISVTNNEPRGSNFTVIFKT